MSKVQRLGDTVRYNRIMDSHERAATKHCTGCGITKGISLFSPMAIWCKQCINAYSKVHYQRNRERILARKAIYRSTHDEQIKIGQAAWRSRNLGRLAPYLKAYRKSNRGKINHLEAKRYIAKTNGTPKWADLCEIERIYAEAKRISAETGIRQSVDHIYPLRGKLVCGLHVPSNLRIIPYLENCKKRDKMPVEDIV